MFTATQLYMHVILNARMEASSREYLYPVEISWPPWSTSDDLRLLTSALAHKLMTVPIDDIGKDMW